MNGTKEEQVESLLAFVGKIHDNLLLAVREAGFRSLAMPTLCTGGIGVPAAIVAIAVVRAVRKDFCRNPSDPLKVRIACFDSDHIPILQRVKKQQLQFFYSLDTFDTPSLVQA